MTGFELMSSGIRSDCAVNCATTTAKQTNFVKTFFFKNFRLNLETTTGAERDFRR